MKNQQGGFTLIELIMVIVILGILAAVALPRFADFSGEARASSLSGALGAVRSASAIVHSAALVTNQTAAAGVTGTPDQVVTLEGQDITLAFGYATAADIKLAAQLSSEFDVVTAGDVATISVGDICTFTYTQATAATGAGSGAVISEITDGVTAVGTKITSC